LVLNFNFGLIGSGPSLFEIGESTIFPHTIRVAQLGAKDLPPMGYDRARNNHKPRVLTDLPTSSMSVEILANEAITVTT
jgi:hypothetical protein